MRVWMSSLVPESGMSRAVAISCSSDFFLDCREPLNVDMAVGDSDGAREKEMRPVSETKQQQITRLITYWLGMDMKKSYNSTFLHSKNLLRGLSIMVQAMHSGSVVNVLSAQNQIRFAHTSERTSSPTQVSNLVALSAKI